MLKALDMAAEMSGCGTPLPTGEARVIALEERGAEGNGSATINAMIHTIPVSREGKVRLERRRALLWTGWWPGVRHARNVSRCRASKTKGSSGALPESGSSRGACALPTVSSPPIVCHVPALRATQREELLIVTRPCCQVGVETLRQLPCLTAHVV
jgi:hypothetical protein